MKAKIDSAKSTRTFGDPPVQVYEVVAGGVVYDCMDKKCMDLIGQEVEFEVNQASDPKYHPRMRFQKGGGQQDRKNFGGKGYQIAFAQTAEGEKLKAKTMALSYAKDMVVQFMTQKANMPFAECLTNIKSAYDTMLPILGLDQIRDVREQPPGNGHKDLATLLAEMKSIASLDALGNWWKIIVFDTLSAEEKKTLIAEKDKKKAEFSAGSMKQNGRQPSF
jgi:hypothetical protein